MKKYILAALLLLPALGSIAQVTFDENAKLPKNVLAAAKPVVEKRAKGLVNWTGQFVEAKGTGIINNEKFKIPAQAKAAAQRAAMADAQRNLLEIVKGVDVNSETTVKDLMLESDNIRTQVQGIVKGAQLQGEPVEKDGAVFVTLRMPLYADNGVADAITDDNATPGKDATTPATDTAGTASNARTAADATGTATTATGPGTETDPAGKASGLKQLALNFLGGKPIDAQLFPVIYDANGNVVLDTKSIYDPNKGEFPKILSAGKSIMKAAGFDKAVDVIDVVQNSDGKITLANTNKNDKWKKLG
ncbi:MAG: hypothetical protein V4543_16110, partial [Bacteroidota bacterium]